MGKKVRKEFHLFNKDGDKIGNGVYYPAGGNIQYYMEKHNFEAWQGASIIDALLQEDVHSFKWVDK